MLSNQSSLSWWLPPSLIEAAGHCATYKFANSAESASLSKMCLHNWSHVTKHDGSKVYTSEFENPTSSPLIALVDTITPVPLLYHVRIFYIVRYNSPITHPSQPTYTFKEFQKRKRKWKRGGNIKKSPKHSQNKTRHNIHIIIIIQIITIPTSTPNIQIHHLKNNIPHPKYTTDIQIHHFKTTFMFPMSIAGVPFGFGQAPRLPGFLITAHHL